MEPPQSLYKQTATRFSLRFFIRPETEVEGRFMLELANTFLSDLLVPGCRPVSLDTKLPGEGRKLNMGEFSERRWNASVKKILAGQYAVPGCISGKRNVWTNVGVREPEWPPVLPVHFRSGDQKC